MSPLPDATITVQDGSSGLVNANADQAHVKVGFCSKGNPAILYAFSDKDTLTETLGGGEGVEAAAHSLSVAGGPIYVAPINELSLATSGSGFAAGTCPSVTQVGSGPAITVPTKSAVSQTGSVAPPAVTLTGTPTRFIDLKVVIVVGGIVATSTFKYSLDGGTTYSATVATASTYLIPNTGVTLNFAAGTYVALDAYTASTCTPWDSYEVQVRIVSGGALGTSTFQYALDALNPDGGTFSATLATPTSGLYVIPGSGITLTWAAGTYVADATYSFTCVAPSYNAIDVTASVGVALADSTKDWGFLHLIGRASSAANSAAMAGTLGGLFDAAAVANRWGFAVLECFDDEAAANATLAAQFASVSQRRVCATGGFERVTSVLSGRKFKRPAGYVLSARISQVSVGTDPAQVDGGELPGTVSLTWGTGANEKHDENSTPTLDSARISSLRTLTGIPGFFATNVRMLAPAGSDFEFVQFRRVMDRACRITRAAVLKFLNGKVRVNPNGTIYELDARRIEKFVNGKLNAGLTQPGEVTAVACVVDRTNNIQVSKNLNVDARVTPLGYTKFISATLGFTNPSLVLV